MSYSLAIFLLWFSANPSDFLMLEGDNAYAKFEYAKALTAYQQAVQLFEKNEATELLATAHYKLAKTYEVLGQTENGISSAKKALTLHEKLQDQSGIGFDLITLGVLERNKGNFKEAVAFGEKALAIFQGIQNKNGIMSALNNLGLTGHLAGNHTKALEHLIESLKIAEELNQTDIRISNLIIISNVQIRFGDLESAKSALLKALSLTTEKDQERIAQIRNNLGRVYWHQGNFEKALESFEASLEFSEAHNNNKGISTNLNNIALVYSDQGLYAESLQYHLRAMKFRQEAKDKSGTASSLGNIGLVHMAIGNAERALDYFQKSLALHLETKSAKLTSAYSNIGRAYNKLGNTTTALEYFQKALKNAETIGEKKSIAIAHYHIGNILKNSNNYDQAIEHFQNAYDIVAELGDRKWMANNLHGLALVYSKKNDPVRAFENNEKAIQIAGEIGFVEALSSALHLQGQLKQNQGDLAEAIRSIKVAINLIEDQRVNLQLEEEKAIFFGEKHDLYEDLIQMLLQNGNIAEALEYSERSKARAFIDMLAESNIDPNSKLDEVMKERKFSLEAKYAELHKKLWAQRDSNESEEELLKKLNAQRKTLDAEYESWKRDIRSQNPEYAALNYPEPLRLPEIQQLLDEKTALLEYTSGAGKSFLFLITNDGLQSFVITGEKEISTRVQEFQKLILNPDPLWETLEKSETRLKAVSKELYRILVKPVASQIANKQRLVIAPDGVLNHLPFEALVSDKRTAAYLVSDFQIHYIPSATALAQIRQRVGNNHKPAQKQFVAFADPNYGSPEGAVDLYRINEFFGKVSRLPNTKTEVEEIAKFYRENAVATFTGEAASEKNVKSIKLDEYEKVHFATHGLINEEQPQFSSLLLSFNQNEKEDGYLMMREIFDLKLNAQLVVLSACRTGLGQEIRGEGVRSLARAFIYAGTSSVLVSLWNVWDKSTADFMKMFYIKMEKEHLNKAAALRAARLQLIREKKYSHPYYWAPFVLIGDQ